MAASSRNTGYLPDNFNPNDKPYYYGGEGWDTNKLKSVDLTSIYPGSPVYNQFDTNSCVANATAAALWYDGKKNPGRLSLDPSRHFIYYNTRAIKSMDEQGHMRQWPQRVEDKGTNIREAMRAVSYLGVASEDIDPWRSQGGTVLGRNDRPVDAAYIDARRTHGWPMEYCRLDPDHTEVTEDMFTDTQKTAVGLMTLTHLKQCLHEGYPVIFGFYYYWTAFETDASPSAKPDNPENKGFATIKPLSKPHQPQPKNLSEAAHAVLAVAWDDDKQRILCKNSWGESDHPYFWMPYHWVSDFEATDDFWVIRTINQAGPILDSEVEVIGKEWNISDIGRSGQDKASITANTVIATAIRNPGTSDIFWITPQGQVASRTYYKGGNGWVRTENVLIEASEDRAALGAIAAVRRNDEQTDIFWIHSNGAVHCSYYNYAMQQGWKGDVIAGPGSASTKSGIAAVTRVRGHQEMWYITPDGAVKGLYYYESDPTGWHQYELAPSQSAHPESNITAASTADGQWMFVFWVSPNGFLTTWEWCDDGRSWIASGSNAVGKPHTAAIHSRIVAANLVKDTMRVFYMDREGKVTGRYRSQNPGILPRKQLWLQRPASNHPGRVDSGLTVVAVSDDSMDVLWIGSDNSLVVGCNRDGSGRSWTAKVVAGSGSVMAGSPLGAFALPNKSYSVAFQDYTGKIILADYQE
ncbi:hypothetical protein QBC32DRAFT_29591 [Pseudoneurospora amorphoporcata]|uniref:Peptidase C1A papain C-terminal domain-containing protein n=1 Tax=Pseudoneurospora amorphoporcata TaxID=241081 RepID=A0AAN6NPT2_9PEZI|nr:hypothetical protein QBC32DRAFT_29591 [Pseudoneurospora amorphoporcata]